MDNEFDAKTLRADRAKRAERMIEPGDPRRRVDASSWTPPESMQTGKQVQPKRPADPLYRAAGGKTVARADRKPRCGGGMMKADGGATNPVPVSRMSFGQRASTPLPGTTSAMKKGGRTGRAAGGGTGDVIPKHELMGLGLAKHMRGAEEDHEVDHLVRSLRHHKMEVPDSLLPSVDSKTALDRLRARGGKASNSDEKQDRALVKKMVKPEARTGKAEGGGKWIGSAIKHPGALREALHAKKGEPIPKKKLEKAEHSKDPTLAKRARLAETLKGMHRPERAFGGKTKRGYSGRGAEAFLPRDYQGPLGSYNEARDREAEAKLRTPEGESARKAANDRMVRQMRGEKVEAAPALDWAKRAKGGAAGHPKGCRCEQCSGGRVERATGGRAKGKTNIVIAVNPGHNAPQMPAPAPQAMAPHPAMPLPVAPPPMAPPQGLAPAGGPPPGAMPPGLMPRKRGGRAYYDLEGGAGSGLGRLEKAASA